MRIAQVAPLIESVPPKHYGGTERIVAYLTEELVRLGHQVTLFASGDSVTNAELVPVCRRSFRQNKRATDYLSRAFLGRASPEKRVDRAIEIAKRVGMPLKIAAKVDPADRRYFKREIEPLLNDPHIEWLGEINDKDKDEFLGNAYALLFPIDWPEPFGLVMIESMACGTPVIAYDCGSVPEVMEDGVTGFIVRDLDDAVKGVNRIRDLSRSGCREVFEKRFAAKRMASDYVDVYKRLSDSDVERTNLSTAPRALVNA